MPEPKHNQTLSVGGSSDFPKMVVERHMLYSSKPLPRNADDCDTQYSPRHWNNENWYWSIQY